MVRQGEGTNLLLNQILNVNFILDFLDVGFPLVAEFIPNFNQLVPQNALHLYGVSQQLLIIGNLLLQFLVFGFQLFPVQTLQGNQTHIADGLRLHIVQAESLHEALLGIVVAGADDVNDFVDVVLGNQQTFQQVSTLLGLAQIVLGSAGQDVHLVCQVFVQNLPQGQNLGLLLVVHQCQHDDAEIGLQGGLLKQIVQHHLTVGILFQLNDNAHTVAVGFVPQVADAIQPLVLYLLGNGFNQLALVDLVGQLGDNDALAILIKGLELRFGTHHHLASAGGVGGANAAASHDDAAGGEIRAGNVLHQVCQGAFRVIQHTHAGVNHLGEIVGRNIGGHAHGDAGGAVDQQIGEPGGQHPGFLPAFIEVGVPVHGLLFDVPEHFVAELTESRLGVTVSSGGIAVHGTEVAVTVHQHIAHGEILRQTHHGIVNRSVAMGMVFTQHVTDAGGRFLKGLVGGQSAFIHGVKNPPMHRFQTVPHVGQGTTHNDAHGVFNIGLLHFLHQFALGDYLVGKGDVLWFIRTIMCHSSTSKL